MTALLVCIGIFYNAIGFARAAPEKIIQGPFPTALYPHDKIYFTREDDDDSISVQRCYPISFFLEKTENNLVQKEKIDLYEEDGGCPEIKSVFFGNIQNKKYIFVMVAWDSKHLGVGIDGDSYQTYVYTKNKQGILSLDKAISDDEHLSGFEGGNNCKSDINPAGDDDCYMHYKYKTTTDVKN